MAAMDASEIANRSIFYHELRRIRMLPQPPLDVQKLLASNVALDVLLEQSKVRCH
jgi:hypothetical protein